MVPGYCARCLNKLPSQVAAAGGILVQPRRVRPARPGRHCHQRLIPPGTAGFACRGCKPGDASRPLFRGAHRGQSLLDCGHVLRSRQTVPPRWSVVPGRDRCCPRGHGGSGRRRPEEASRGAPTTRRHPPRQSYRARPRCHSRRSRHGRGAGSGSRAGGLGADPAGPGGRRRSRRRRPAWRTQGRRGRHRSWWGDASGGWSGPGKQRGGPPARFTR